MPNSGYLWAFQPPALRARDRVVARARLEAILNGANMAEIDGVAITDITASGWSDDGRHIWITHRLRDGSEYRLIYPCEAAVYLITTISHAARSAYRRLARRDPHAAAVGMNTDVIPLDAVKVAASADNRAILHMTTADNVPIAVELPAGLLEVVIEQLQRVSNRLKSAAPAKRLH